MALGAEGAGFLMQEHRRACRQNGGRREAGYQLARKTLVIEDRNRGCRIMSASP